jgi:hypothetical protein
MKRYFFLLVFSSFTSWLYAQQVVELLHDTAFHDGFRAFWTGDMVDGNADLKLGNITSYHTPWVNDPSMYGTNYTIHSWPDSASASSDVNKYWNFGEGLHEGYADEGTRPFWTNANGTWNPIYDLAVHRLEANARLISWDEPDVNGNNGLVWLESYNNLYDPSQGYYNPHYLGLVRTVYGNRAGNLYTYMNTENEIHNIAVNNSSDYARDTWPHFLLEQNFKQLVDPASFSTITFSANLRVGSTTFHNCGIWNCSFQDAIYGVVFTLRKKQTLLTVVFLSYDFYSVHADQFGNVDYSAAPPEYSASFGIDQAGRAQYNGNIYNVGGPLVPNDRWPFTGGSTFKTIELRQFFADAVATATAHGPYLDPDTEARRQEFIQTSLDDYYISAISIGWETMGWEEVSSEISAVSLRGVSW